MFSFSENPPPTLLPPITITTSDWITITTGGNHTSSQCNRFLPSRWVNASLSLQNRSAPRDSGLELRNTWVLKVPFTKIRPFALLPTVSDFGKCWCNHHPDIMEYSFFQLTSTTNHVNWIFWVICSPVKYWVWKRDWLWSFCKRQLIASFEITSEIEWAVVNWSVSS